MHGVYKYEVDGEVVYVGKTDSTFSARIECHRRERSFAQYRSNAKIFVKETKDAREADFLETVLISQYKPKLNIQKKNVTDIKVCAEVDWVIWDEYNMKKRSVNSKRQKMSRTFYLSECTIEELKKAKQKGFSVSEYVEALLRASFGL